ncbi:helix-turn-helix domain-containing protein [Modestobacter marinus]|uniref:helix-turn-helix domain-containing protein n=1 Tax=Modestobacter marinus TaxID=477641 RepID=UPI001C9653BD|nr:helix-turn-helix transcriptional regulator [Modestobacter marinus]
MTIAAMGDFDLPGTLRRIRRRADLSQRELARACTVALAVVSHAEAGRRGGTVEFLSRAAVLAGLRLALLDETGTEVGPMDGDAVRDDAGRRFPAHLDTRYGDDCWWHGPERYSRAQPTYTFDRCRDRRDARRRRLGSPDDHQVPRPGDSPAARRARRQADAQRRWHEEVRRRQEAGELRECPEWDCACPPECAEQDAGELPAHISECPCECDVD